MPLNTAFNRALFDDVMVPNYAPFEMIPVRGLGSRVWDQAEREYVDFSGGIAVNCLGHCHPALVQTIQEQSQKIWHVSNWMTNEPALRLAKKLVDNTFADKVFFANSGAEANEAAFKLARRWAFDNHGADKSQIIAFKQGFHGRTFFTVTVGGQEAYSAGFGPKPGDIHHSQYNCLESLKSLISNKTCAVVMEPMQGEGGVINSTSEFMQGVRALCDEHNALLILDEVQTGIGRLGSLYAYMDSGVKPDIVTSAKALGGGFPISAMLTTSDIAKHFSPGTHGTTYGGNPLACAVAETAFDIVNTPEVLAGVVEKGEYIHKVLSEINDTYNVFSEIRGKGLLIGAVLNEQYKDQAMNFVNIALSEGLVMLVAGANVVRFAPALIISKEDIDEGLNRFTKTIKRIVEA